MNTRYRKPKSNKNRRKKQHEHVKTTIFYGTIIMLRFGSPNYENNLRLLKKIKHVNGFEQTLNHVDFVAFDVPKQEKGEKEKDYKERMMSAHRHRVEATIKEKGLKEGEYYTIDKVINTSYLVFYN